MESSMDWRYASKRQSAAFLPGFPLGLRHAIDGIKLRFAQLGIKRVKGAAQQFPQSDLATKGGKRKNRSKQVDGHQQEQTDLVATLRKGDRYNEGYYGATSSFTAVLGRMATYSGKVVTWDEAISKGIEEYPYGQDLTMASTPPVTPDGYGNYPVPVPGKYNPYSA